MKWQSMALAMSVLLASCGTTTQYGIVNVPLAEGRSDASAKQAIERALGAGETSCPLEIVALSAPLQASPNTFEQVATVKVCGKTQEYAIQRSQVKEDQVLIAAKRI
jgi:hypothetical protein